MGTLYIVATPIGNLQDISLRCAKTLFEVQYIACEDTRRTGLLLKYIKGTLFVHGDKYSNRAKLVSYYEQNELQRIPQILQLLKNGDNVALVSDCGTPTISDPGFKLVRECIKQGIKVEVIPGASSVLSALVVSGLPTDKFLFLGYPPKKEGRRKKLFQDITLMISIIKVTIIIFEAPHRLVKTLGDMKEAFGNIDIVICRELTKVHEEVRKEKIEESTEHFQKTKPKGEFVILFHPIPKKQQVSP